MISSTLTRNVHFAAQFFMCKELDRKNGQNGVILSVFGIFSTSLNDFSKAKWTSKWTVLVNVDSTLTISVHFDVQFAFGRDLNPYRQKQETSKMWSFWPCFVFVGTGLHLFQKQTEHKNGHL